MNRGMKILDSENLNDFLISDSISTSEQNCTMTGYPSIAQLQEEAKPSASAQPSASASAASAEQIEQEVNDLLHKHAGALSRYAGNVSRDKALAQDGIQETFLRYFVVRVRGQKIDNPRAWLFRVLRNYLLDCSRKSGSMPSAELKEAVQIVDLRQDVEAGYQQSETLQRALTSLSPREGECLQLRLAGFGYEEIAQILQIRSGTVGALLARALKKVRIAGSYVEGR